MKRGGELGGHAPPKFFLIPSLNPTLLVLQVVCKIHNISVEIPLNKDML